MKKNILMLHQGAELYGSDKIFLLTASTLAQEYNVDIVLPHNGPLVEELKKTNVKSIEFGELGTLRREAISSPKKILTYATRTLSSIRFLKNKSKEKNYSAVYVNTLALITPLLVFKTKKIPIIHHIHEIQNSPKFLFKILYTLSTALTNVTITVSTPVHDHILKISAIKKTRKPIILHNGIPNVEIKDEDRNKTLQFIKSKKLVNDDTFLIAMVGRIHTWKGQLELIDILHRLKSDEKIENFLAIIYGSHFEGYEWLTNEIKEKITRLNLDNNILMAGERRDAASLFSLCDITLLPSTSPDPLPTVVLESMSQGTPVISYDHGGAIEMISHGKTGLLVPASNPEKFKMAIAKLYNDRGYAKELGVMSKIKFNEEFSIEKYQLGISKIVKDTICQTN